MNAHKFKKIKRKYIAIVSRNKSNQIFKLLIPFLCFYSTHLLIIDRLNQSYFLTWEIYDKSFIVLG